MFFFVRLIHFVLLYYINTYNPRSAREHISVWRRHWWWSISWAGVEVILLLNSEIDQKGIFCELWSSEPFRILTQSPPSNVLDSEQFVLEWPDLMFLHSLSLPATFHKVLRQLRTTLTISNLPGLSLDSPSLSLTSRSFGTSKAL